MIYILTPNSEPWGISLNYTKKSLHLNKAFYDAIVTLRSSILLS